MSKDKQPPLDEVKFVTCQECGNEQGDMGVNVNCEECGHGPMPYYDRNDKLVTP